jgi:hypothetical protein
VDAQLVRDGDFFGEEIGVGQFFRAHGFAHAV